MSVAPCKDCERKGCGAYHDECPTYLEWLEERRAITEKIREENKINSEFRKSKRRRRY